MLITASVEYVCLAMLELAARYSSKPVRLAEVTEKHKIPQRFLVQILLQMKAAGLVNTTRGAAGGYQLARPPDKITLADIFAVLDRMEQPEAPRAAPSSMGQKLLEVWKALAENQTRFLQRFTLQDLLPREGESDYVI